VRSIFVQWSLLRSERDRPLRDLAERTTVDSIELSHVDLVWGLGDPRTDPAPLALPPDERLSEPALPTLAAVEFEELRGLLALVAEHGFAIVCNLSPLYVPAPERRLACVDHAGAAVPGIHPRLPVYGCPANPEVVRLGEELARAFVRSWRPLDAVALNHLEYPLWPQSTVHELLACFCESCASLAAARGLDLERVRRELGALLESARLEAAGGGAGLRALLQSPELEGWLHLRQDAVAAYAGRVVAALRDEAEALGTPLRVGLEFQLPTLAPLVGTDFARLAPLFDWVTPKFPDYLPGSVVPAVAEELANGRGDPRPLRQDLRDLLGLGLEPARLVPAAQPSEGLLYAGAFSPDTIVRQCGLVEGRVAGRPVHPYLWLYGGDLESVRAKRSAAAECGWDGFSLWCWDSDLTSEALRGAEGIL
jgi:hypothetical protein